jgi:hypothetical protein
VSGAPLTTLENRGERIILLPNRRWTPVLPMVIFAVRSRMGTFLVRKSSLVFERRVDGTVIVGVSESVRFAGEPDLEGGVLALVIARFGYRGLD